MLSTIIQIYTACTAPTALYLLGHGFRKSSCVIGACSQIGFFLLFTISEQWIMYIPTFIYSLVWISNWKERNGRKKTGPPV